MLDIRNLHFGYPHGERTLRDISFAIAPGEVLCVLGRNGAGKTTLIRCILGDLAPSQGTILVEGVLARTLKPRQFARRIAHVPQTTQSVFGHLVIDIVLMGRSAHLSMIDMPGKADRLAAEQALERVGIAHLAQRPFAVISGGERQLCLLARALAQGASILIMDEPAASLDFGNQIRVLDIVTSLARSGFAILMTTHHPDHALLVASQVLCLRDGVVFGSGEPGSVLSSRFLSDLYGAPIRIVEESDGTRACIPVLTPPHKETVQHA